MTSHAVTIDHLHSVYRVPEAHPEPGRARDTLDRALRHSLAEACGASLAGRLPADDPSICLIRRLDIEFALNLDGLNEAHIAHLWGDLLAEGIVRALAQGGDEVIYFPDSASYTAQFLVDLMGGGAWGKWYYAAFEGLRSLPPSMAAREALVREAGHASPVLRALHAENRLEMVLRLLSAGDAERVFQAIRADAGSAPTRTDVMQVLSVWPTVRLHTGSRAHQALRMAAALPAAASGGIEAVLALAEALQGSPMPASLIAALAAGRPGDAAALLPAEHAAIIPPWIELAAGDRRWLESVAQTVAPAPTPAHLATSAAPEMLLTPFGGAFLLLRSMQLYGLDRLLSLSDEDAALLRVLIVAKALGDSNALYDPVVGRIAGLRRPPTADDWARLNRLSPDALMGRLAERLIEAGRATGAALWAERIAYRGEAFTLVRDLAYDAWLTPPAPALPDDLPARCLFLGDSVDEAPFAHVPVLLRGSPTEWETLPDSVDDEARRTWARTKARLKPADAELQHLTRAGGELDPALDMAVALLARAVARAFASRLMGFEWSSLPYLTERFLSGLSAVTINASAIEVQLPQLPLNMILSMAGIDGEQFTLPWLDGVQISVRLS
jgi:hypothetical protein